MNHSLEACARHLLFKGLTLLSAAVLIAFFSLITAQPRTAETSAATGEPLTAPVAHHTTAHEKSSWPAEQDASQ